MSTASAGRSQLGRSIAARLPWHALVFGVVWGILSGGRGWVAGIPVVLLASLASCALLPRARWSLLGLARFLPYFAWNSLRGGTDVALRALNPALPVEPALLNYRLRVEGTVARVFMANAVTLLPGTLSADLQADILVVHVLNARGPFPAALEQLEHRVADVFCQQLRGAAP